MPRSRTFLANSGTEAVEGALKLARHHTGRPNVIAFYGAFHGRSLGSLSLTSSKAKYRSGFGIVTPGAYHAPFAFDGEPNGVEYIEEVLFQRMTEPGDVAAIFVEPIQGEGGYVVPPAGWLAELRELCDRHGILLVMDEVQSGIGRTGKMWACEHDGVVPDIITAGKGLASGLPLAALIARDEIMQWSPGKHGSTFGGNPVACAAAVATLDLVEGGLMANATTVGDQLLTGLRSLAERQPMISAVRGRGLMIGFDVTDHDTAEARRAGLLPARPAGAHLRQARHPPRPAARGQRRPGPHGAGHPRRCLRRRRRHVAPIRSIWCRTQADRRERRTASSPAP